MHNCGVRVTDPLFQLGVDRTYGKKNKPLFFKKKKKATDIAGLKTTTFKNMRLSKISKISKCNRC